MNSLEVDTEEVTFNYQNKGHLRSSIVVTNNHNSHAYFKVPPPISSLKSPAPNTTSSNQSQDS